MEIIFCEGKSLISKAIMLFSSKRGCEKVSHVAIRYSEPEHEWMVEASCFGVEPDWWQYFIKRYDTIYRYRYKPEGGDAALDKLIDKYGHKPYDYLEVLGFAIKIVFKKIGITIKNPLGSRNELICTELAQELLRETADVVLKGLDKESMTPIELHEWVKNSECFDKIVKSI